MHLFPRPLRFWTAVLMLVYLGGLDLAPAVAGLAPSAVSGTTSIASERDADLIQVQRLLEHKLVAQKLRDYGVDPAAAKARLANASDEELHRLATASKGLPAGGDSLGVIIAVLLIVLLVIVILKLLNKEIVVK